MDSSIAPELAALLTAKEAARALSVSVCWVYRHRHKLPAVRVGRLLRFNRSLLLRGICDKRPATSNRLNPERRIQVRRYQRGCVFKQGKESKVWYGMWRQDVKQPDGTLKRRQCKMRLGTVSELPTKAAAFEEL